MTRLEKIFVALGSVLASAPSLMAAVVMPQFRKTFQSFSADLPWLTQMLSDYPASLLLFPALVLLVAFAWPNEKQRGLFSLLLGMLFGLLGSVIILVGAYLPVWKLDAAI
ncbi:MAG: hypothetical protein KatS3mg128_0586 [Silanimonas sp.]|nr:MAG: hypothetical protein KatS3mg128_0586 [Silanimonas sp.]